MINLANYKAGWVSIAEIDASNIDFQFRNNLQVEDLAASFKEEGQKFPVVLWRRNEGKLQVISGFRRINAAKSLSWENILAIVIPEHDMPKDEALRLNFIENLERKSLTSLDMVFACKKLHDQGMNNVQIGKLIARDESMVRKYLAIANAGEDVQKSIMAGETAIRNVGKTGIGTRPDFNSAKKRMVLKQNMAGFQVSVRFNDKKDDIEDAIEFFSKILEMLIIKKENKEKK